MRPRAIHHACGWTLVELLVSVAIIAVLASILVLIAATARRTANASRCANNMRQVWVMVSSYTVDHADTLPGPLWTGQRAVLSSDARMLVRRLYDYLGNSHWKNGDFIEEFSCPAWSMSTPTTSGPSLFAQNRVRLSTGTVNPWGYLDQNRGVDTQPQRLSRILADCQGPVPWAITENDKLQPDVNTSTGWYDELPEGMAHRSYRNAVFFDGHIGKLNQKNEPL